jgi:hypothetical protein
MPWTVDIEDHPQRADSPGYVRSRALMVALVKLCQPWVFGPPPYQDHHGGGIWLKDTTGWQLILGLVGCEWSLQFMCDPKKVDDWRIRTKRFVDAFPETVPGYESLGYHDARQLLDTPITDPTAIGLWVDSIFNASVPLPALDHTGVRPKGAGMHHYPKPIKDGDFLKHDDYVFWVKDAQGQPAAVTPVAARGSGNSAVRVAYATPGTKLHKAHLAAHQKGKAVIFSGRHPLAKQAFAKQS